MARSVVVGVRGCGIRERLIRLLHVAFLGNTLVALSARLRHCFASSAVRAGAGFIDAGRAQAMIKISAPNRLSPP